MKIFFSIIIPTYKRYHNDLLKEAIESVLKQKKGNYDFEIIVVDDATPGGIPRLFYKKFEKSANIKFTNLERNLGTPKAIAEGIKDAKGDYIVILGDDDLLPKNSLFLRSEFIIKNPGLDWFYGKTQRLNQKGEPIETYSQSQEFKDHHYARMFTYNFIQGGTTTVKKSVYDNIKWPEWLTTRDDDFIAFELVRPKKYEFAFLNSVVYGYRSHNLGERESEKNIRTKKIKAIDARIRNEIHDPELAFLADIIKEKDTEIAGLKRERDITKNELRDRDERLRKIYKSLFWKATYPLRKIKRIFQND